jgi:hypothetical protein
MLRVFSYLYLLCVSLFLTGISLVVILSGAGRSLQVEAMFWKSNYLAWWVLGFGALGVVSVVLASTGKARTLLLVCALAIFAGMVRGFFLSPHMFQGLREFWWAVGLTTGAFLAVAGAWRILRQRPSRRSVTG